MLAFVVAAVAVVGNSPVSADSCVAQLGYSSLSTTQYYYNSNIGINVPVSASCSFMGGQLYAVGDAYDTAVNTDLGLVSTMLTPVYGNSNYNGQLVFNLPASIVGHSVQITVSIYSGSPYGYSSGGNGLLLATAAQRVQVNVSNDQNGYYQSCGYYSGCSNPPPAGYTGNYNACPSTGNSSTVQCSGYIYVDANGCVYLAVPIETTYWTETRIYQYYTLQNLPPPYPDAGTLVTVSGQVYNGNNVSPNGAACPSNYINVASRSH